MNAPERTLPGPGDDFAGKYTLEKVLGEGGMGVVYLATHRRLSQRVAIKMLQPELLKHPEVVARFEREARAAGQLRSKHAVRILDVGELPTGEPFMVMEYLEGSDLSSELVVREKLPVTEAVDLMVEACAAMSEAHGRGIVHRDLKPSNLFLAEEDGARVLKVLDFGISKLDEGGSAVTATQATMGTPLYMSPEQLRSTKLVDLRADVWSLGIILYELLAGRPPFEGAPAAVGAAIVADPVPSLREARPEVPEGLAAVVATALEKDRDKRWSDARSFAQALAPWASAPLPRELAGTSASPTTSPKPKLEPFAPTLAATPPTGGVWTHGSAAPRRRAWVYAAFGVAVVALAAITTSFVGRGATSGDEPQGRPAATAAEAPPPATSPAPTPPSPVQPATSAPAIEAPPPSVEPSASASAPAIKAPLPKPTPHRPTTPGQNPNRL